MEHKRPKGFYPRTSKKNVPNQLAKHERRQRLIRGMEQRLSSLGTLPVSSSSKKRKNITHTRRGAGSTLKVGFHEDEPLSAGAFELGYHVSVDQRMPLDLTDLLWSNREDPAYKVFFYLTSLHVAFYCLWLCRISIEILRDIFSQS